MRPRIVQRMNGTVSRLPASKAASEAALLRSVDAPGAPVDSAELWIGVHIFEPGAVSLERLARSAQRFTPRVSLVAPDGLLLEVKGSLHLFGGADGLIRALAQECGAIGIQPAIALAPTPLAATVAARVGKPYGKPHGYPFSVTNQAQLVGRLSSLPLAPLRWPQDVVERLARMGVRTIGQALRLPRAGFARRFGPEQLAELDRLIGRKADLRHHFQPRERFRRRRELTYELENNEAVLAVLAPVLADLGKFLQERQCGITELECRLRHRHAPPSICIVRLAEPVAEVARLTHLLGERLSALTLPEPVRSCELRSGLPILRVLASNPLWQPGEYGGSGGPEAPQLIERLRARLGHEAVYGLQTLAGHRPENAWGMREPSADGSASRLAVQPPPPPWLAFRRPLWLLHAPQQLDELDGVPRRRGALRFFGDVERIETGWWDGGDIGRDYYTVFDIYGVQLWIFRERAEPHRWFLHGVFG
ncbi:MAG: Y-family DNA polymerase [Steroidobacteraceae bacterium]